MANKVISNVTLEWCKFTTVDNYGHYGCKVILSPEAAKKIKSLGLKYKTEEGVDYIRVRSKDPVVALDKDLTPVECSIANGATANILLDVYKYKQYGGGIACRLKKVQLIDWEPFEEGESFSPVEDDEQPF